MVAHRGEQLPRGAAGGRRLALAVDRRDHARRRGASAARVPQPEPRARDRGRRDGGDDGAVLEAVLNLELVRHAARRPAIHAVHQRRVAALELDLDALCALAGHPVEAQSVPTMPAATQDLSLVVNADIPAEAVRAAVIAGAGELLEDIRLVDVYAGDGVPAGQRSLTFALRFRASDRTLTQAEATEAKQAGVAAATAAFGATIRE